MKVGLVLEGGAMRGLYTAGVLDVFMDNKIKVDGIIGTSAGALFGVNYFSNQKGRVIRYNRKYCNDIRYISKASLLLTGNLVNKKFAFYKMSLKLDKFDNETFIKTNKDFYAVVTNIESGKAEYIKITDPIKQMEYLRATSAMPIVSRVVKIDNKKYLDGGISDSIALDKMLDLGYDKIIVVLTQPLEYRKEGYSPSKEKLIRSKFKKYPNLIKTMMERPDKYNKTVEKIIDLENKKEIFVIRPSKKININITKMNKDKLQEVYDLGVNDTNKVISKLKNYLK